MESFDNGTTETSEPFCLYKVFDVSIAKWIIGIELTNSFLKFISFLQMCRVPSTNGYCCKYRRMILTGLQRVIQISSYSSILANGDRQNDYDCCIAESLS